MGSRQRISIVVVTCALLAACTSAREVAGTPNTLGTTDALTTSSSTPAHSSPPPRNASSTPASRKPTHTTAPRPGTTAARRPTSAPPPAPTFGYPPGSGPLVVLNPGHNGGNATHTAQISRQVPAGFGQYKDCDTTGTSTNGGYPEHAFNWDVTLRVRAVLQAHGVRVALTRPDDSGVGPCVDERAAIGNAPGVAAVVSIHADGTPSGAGQGFHVCEDSRAPAGAAVAARSHALSVAVHDALVTGSGLVPSTYIGSNGYYPRSDLAGLNLAVRPATFLELGNMRNGSDAALLTSASGRQRIAVAVAAGILAYLHG